jgi:hypothetical protein
MAWTSSDVDFYVTDPQRVGWQPLNETSTVRNHQLGTIVQVFSPTYGQGEAIYLQGVASTALADWVIYESDTYTTARLVANAIGAVAIALSANVASQYGWYMIGGKVPGTATAIADNGHVYGTATPGNVDDVIVAGDRVQNARAASATNGPSATTAEFEIYRPFVNDALAD